MDVRSLWSTIIEEPPSCVAFHPRKADILVVGTYVLHSSTADDGHDVTNASLTSNGTQQRTGSLLLYTLSGTSLQRQQRLETISAVLDIEWSLPAERDILAVATSIGTIDLYKLSETSQLQQITSYQVSDTSTLVLDLLWHPKEEGTIAATFSSGEVVLCRGMKALSDSQTNEHDLTTMTTHTLEPWTLAFSLNADRLFSGGDDMVFQCVDITTSSPLWSDRRSHQAGITAIMPIGNQLVVTGSYDDHIRLLYAPDIGRRQVQAELNLGGGVWRLKLLQGPVNSSDTGNAAAETHQRYIILASCMHAGARVVQLTQQAMTRSDGEGEWSFEVLARFQEHESMNYGSDACPSLEQSPTTFVSTSFYDRRLCLWQYTIPPLVE
ncbi:hypothetical protein AMS68_001842 [Peltaster fructicola]|uniref:methylated diphthine methylhydrolase n=1 Tax=Peltaster fructicola TaxID=286661 RepID=A0A6H0XNW9_9PEZI|nr:hypothetical protein AMS68_001842 [Peltaster fructicola]